MALVARIAAGDERALGALYDLYATAVYSLAHSITNSEAAAESAVADAFARVWREARSFDANRTNVFLWLTSRVRRSALAQSRSRGASPVTAPSWSVLRGPQCATVSSGPAGNGTGDVLDSFGPSVREALSELPHGQRRALELAFFGGLTTREIAVEMDEPEGRIGQELRSGMQSLRLALSPWAATFDEGVMTRA